MAAADFTAIEYVLDREVDVDTLRLAGNFDVVAKGRHEPCAQQDSKIHSTAGCAPCQSTCQCRNVTACTNTYEYQASVPQRAGLEIRLMLPLCSCNDNHDVRQTVIVIDIDLTCQILSRTREIDREKPSPGLVLKWRRL